MAGRAALEAVEDAIAQIREVASRPLGCGPEELAVAAGRVINPALARGQIVGAMGMALGFAGSEAFRFDERERLLNGTLRDFRIPRYGDQPRYIVDFLETPQRDGGISGPPPGIAVTCSPVSWRRASRS